MRGKKITLLLLAAICTGIMTDAGTRIGWNGKVYAARATNDVPIREEAGGEDQPQQDSWPAPPQLEGEKAILMEVNSGTILYEKNSRLQGYPASITKIATAIVAIENGDFNDKVTFSSDAVFKTEGSGIWRDVDEVMTLEECMYAMMLESANECAYAIAEHVGGTYDHFIEMMNDKAAELGCEGTHFNNPNGLPDEEHYTTCYDMALISSYALKNNTFRQIVGTIRYDIPPTNKHEEITYLTNHHKMIKRSEDVYYEPCVGGKTGYTNEAGNTLVTFAEKDGVTLVCVVLQESKSSQYADTRVLLDWGFENFYNYNISEQMEASVREASKTDNLSKKGKERSGFLEGGSFADIDKSAVITLPTGVPFSAAVQKLGEQASGTEVAGTLEFTYQDRIVGAADIVRTMEEPQSYPFGIPQQTLQAEEPVEKKGSVTSWKIVWIVLGIIGVCALGFGIYKFADNFHLIRYKMMSRRSDQMHLRIIGRKSRRRRR